MSVGNNQDMVSLEPEDVPGALLNQNKRIEDHSIRELHRWLECRGLKRTGNKCELIERVVNCIKAGRENNIFIGVDTGKWYDQKRNLHNAAAPANTSGMLCDPLQWSKFPSRSIPHYFNKGHIYTYIVGTNFESEEYQVQDMETGTTEKPFRRGSQFVSSDYIHDIYDANNLKFYYLKAKCNSSFRKNVLYCVHITLNRSSGAVISGQCECKQSALGKCSHVSALLLFLWKFIEDNGYDGTASTSKLRQWGLGSKEKHPGPVASKTYITKRFSPLQRANFDPRPAVYERCKNINNFICDIQRGLTTTAFDSVLKLNYDDFELDTEEVQVIIEKVNLFKKNMAEYMSTYATKVFQIRGAEVQGSEAWEIWRTYFFTASNTKTASSLLSNSAKCNYVKKNLWQLIPAISTQAIHYGRRYEATARKKYVAEYLVDNEKLIEVGLYGNKDYPHLACSVDGVVIENEVIKRIIEIKCPKILENEDPCNFENVIKKKQCNFYIEKNNGQVNLKPNHPYLYQVVTSMLIFNVQECDFIIWSKVNMLVFKVKLENVESQIIQNVTVKLKHLYYNMYIPELFLMRIPRNLPILHLSVNKV